MLNKTSKKLRMRRRSVKKGGRQTITFTIFGEGLDNMDTDINGNISTKITMLTADNTTADLYTAVMNRRPGKSETSPEGILRFRQNQQWQFQLYTNERFLGLPVDDNNETSLKNIPRTLYLLNASQTEQELFEKQQMEKKKI
jgi:plasmid maintenance system killer protein